MRLFIALDIDESIREGIAAFVEQVRAAAPEVRWTRPESLHVTLKFVGEKPSEIADKLKANLAKVQTSPFQMSFRGVGYFPDSRSARVFWIGIEAEKTLITLAHAVEEVCAAVGIANENRAFSPHLTLARSGSGAPGRHSRDKANRRFAQLQDKLSKMEAPSFGTMTAREFVLYQSRTLPDGAQYTKLARFSLNS
jgi:2'-5' RNA ligase